MIINDQVLSHCKITDDSFFIKKYLFVLKNAKMNWSKNVRGFHTNVLYPKIIFKLKFLVLKMHLNEDTYTTSPSRVSSKR